MTTSVGLTKDKH